MMEFEIHMDGVWLATEAEDQGPVYRIDDVCARKVATINYHTFEYECCQGSPVPDVIPDQYTMNILIRDRRRDQMDM